MPVLRQIRALAFIYWCVLISFASGCTAETDTESLVVSEWSLTSAPDSKPVDVVLPSYLGARIPPDEPTFSLLANVSIPEKWRGKDLSLSFRDLPGLVTLTVDGKNVLPSIVGITENHDSAYRRNGPQLFRIEPFHTGGVKAFTGVKALRLELTLKRSWPQAVYFPAAPRLSLGGFGPKGFHRYCALQTILNITALATLLTLTFIFLVNYLMRKKQGENLYLVFQFLGPAIWLFFKLGILHLLFGAWDGQVALLAITIAVLCGTGVTFTLFRVRGFSNYWFVLPFLIGASSFFYLNPHSYFNSFSFLAADLFVFILVLMNIVPLVRLTFKRRENASLFLSAWCLLEVTCSTEFARYAISFFPGLATIGGVELSWFGLIAFSVLQLIALGRERTSLFFAHEALNEELERKNIALTKADKLKDEFLANTSHELRTPLNGIIGIADSLLAGAAGKLSEKTSANLKMISNSGRRLANLINDILDFSKLKNQDTSLNTKPVDVRAVAETVVTISRQLAAGKELVLKNKVASDLPAALGDEDRLQQVLYNLIGNAVKFTRIGEVSVSAHTQGDQIEIRVRDTGCGIPPEKQGSIFKPFEQADASVARSFEGAGMGLGISRKLVELHGGELWLESSSDNGSTFCFTLPQSPLPKSPEYLEDAKEGEAAQGPQIPATPLLRTSTVPPSTVTGNDLDGPPQPKIPLPRVLVVDDDPVNLQVAVNLLSMEDMSVSTAQGGNEAMQLFRSEDPFDLVLLDVMMPEITGLEVCKWLRETYTAAELPILLVTAKNRLADLIEGLACGANDYIVKPFAREELLARVHTHLKVRTAHEALEENLRLRSEIELREQTESDLRLTQRRLTGVLDTIDDALIAINEYGEICFGNLNLEQKIGYDAAELLGKPFAQYLADESSKKTGAWVAGLDENVKFLGDTQDSKELTLSKKDGGKVRLLAARTALQADDERLVILILHDPDKAGGVQALQHYAGVIEALNRNRDRLLSLENSLEASTPQIMKRNPQFMDDLHSIDAALDRLGKDLLENKPPSDKRALAVELMNTALDIWCSTTGKDKSDFATLSGLWTVYMNRDGHQRTQTLDRYLSLETLPKRPRWKQIVRSVEFAIENGPLSAPKRDQLETLLLEFQRRP